MTTRTEPLIKVQTLKRSHAAQIQVVGYDPTAESLFRELALAIAPHRATGEVLGFIEGRVLKELNAMASSTGRYWLVQHRNRLYWLYAASKGEAREYYDHRLEQLFV